VQQQQQQQQHSFLKIDATFEIFSPQKNEKLFPEKLFKKT
jgi:hypothetical protein